MNGAFDTAQICINGHVINTWYESSPEFNENFCRECGSKSITACPSCDARIRGSLRDDWNSSRYTVPGFCSSCGSAYPWTTKRVNAAHELIRELDELTESEKLLLEKSIDDIVKDSPETSVATTRFKKLMLKVGEGAASAFREILVDIASESARKMLWP